MSITVTLSGQEVITRMSGLNARMKTAVDRRLAREAEVIARDMKQQYPKAFSTLVNSVRADRLGEMSYLVGAHVEHAWYIEKGRRAGRMPPIDVIMRWGVVKGLLSPGDKRGAFGIARGIARRGTQPQPVVTKQANLQRWRDQIFAGVNQAVASAI